MNIKKILLSALVSCLLCMFLFTFIVHKPLTIGVMKKYYDFKLNYLSGLQGRKLIILAGSNGRLSHSCEVIEKILDFSCSNMSITANISLDYQLDVIRPYLSEGDVVYLPLEYGALKGGKDELMSGFELPYILSYDHDSIIAMDLDRIIHGLFYFDIKYLFSGISEMILQEVGVKRRFNLSTLTDNGDEKSHTVQKSEQYRSYLKNLKWKPPTSEAFDGDSYKANIVRSFLKWSKDKGIKVIGGLPTTFDDLPVPDVLIKNISRYYLDEGHCFILLENQSQYPRSLFFDTAYHLNEFNQRQHSLKIGESINAIISSSLSGSSQYCNN